MDLEKASEPILEYTDKGLQHISKTKSSNFTLHVPGPLITLSQNVTHVTVTHVTFVTCVTGIFFHTADAGIQNDDINMYIGEG